MSDREVLERAAAESHILLTFDKDFGELAWRFGLSAASDIVPIRLPMSASADVRAKIANLVMARIDWQGHFSVIEPKRLRIRPLP